jgi:GABA(A) receptor-associated protein|uniref:Autophagy-related protein n=1 Tax=viral metagenome TaxID=1070528 RepID=A0A6C0LV19_9ZZZZ
MIGTEFKNKFSLVDRLAQSDKIKRMYPSRVPIIVKMGEGVPKIDKEKFLVPRDLKVCEFMCIIRKRIKISAEKSLYMFFDKKMVISSAMMGEVYEDSKSEDDFLYVHICCENTFG